MGRKGARDDGGIKKERKTRDQANRYRNDDDDDDDDDDHDDDYDDDEEEEEEEEDDVVLHRAAGVHVPLGTGTDDFLGF
ncbi:hypothetical protein K0M31_014262 [Melipona bicolor]|uniref:Uncharacterized protein n=1 Tax=Melipona bicolor TaxID=60889 RepID=A0AA40G873_9HYME|nr:hypothetical protein K0M31_014262 [Melipona bicolor]